MRNKKAYPENWNDEIRPAILKRDGFKCCDCGIAHRSYIFIDQNNKRIRIDRDEHLELKKEGMRTYRIYLQVAHKDNVKANCNESNLISLCNNCHYMRDAEWKKVLRLAGKHVPEISLDDIIPYV